MNTTENLSDVVVSRAEQYESLDNSLELPEPLAVEYRVQRDKSINEIVLTMTYGGPTVKLYLRKGTIKGDWAGEDLSVSVRNEPLLTELWDYYESLF